MGKVIHECLVRGDLIRGGDKYADCDIIYEFTEKGKLRYQGYALRYSGDDGWMYFASEDGTAEDVEAWKQYAVNSPRYLSDFAPDTWDETDTEWALLNWPKTVLKYLEERKILLRMML